MISLMAVSGNTKKPFAMGLQRNLNRQAMKICSCFVIVSFQFSGNGLVQNLEDFLLKKGLDVT